MNDDRLLLEMRRWLQEERVAQPDAEEAGQQVAAQLSTIRQRRRRRWRRPFFARTPERPDTRDTTAFRLSPIPATNGHTPTVIGRTTSMLSPVKAITVGAIAFAIGGTFLIAQPFEQQGVVPGAEAETVVPTKVTGRIIYAPRPCVEPDAVQDGDVLRLRNRVCSPMTWITSDPRLSGQVTLVESEDTYQTDDGVVTVGVVSEFVSNDEGEWVCSDAGWMYEGEGDAGSYVGTTTANCTGRDGYEGLSAMLIVDVDALAFEGLIFPGALPPTPERPAAE